MPKEDVTCGKHFFSLTKKCCNGKVVPKKFICLSLPLKCGWRRYNPKTHRCCNLGKLRKVVPRYAICPSPPLTCGLRRYNPKTHRCCYLGKLRKVVPRYATCPRPPLTRTCGLRRYNPKTHKCCDRRILTPLYRSCPLKY